jgi:hypothetical protein
MYEMLKDIDISTQMTLAYATLCHQTPFYPTPPKMPTHETPFLWGMSSACRVTNSSKMLQHITQEAKECNGYHKTRTKPLIHHLQIQMAQTAQIPGALDEREVQQKNWYGKKVWSKPVDPALCSRQRHRHRTRTPPQTALAANRKHRSRPAFSPPAQSPRE